MAHHRDQLKADIIWNTEKGLAQTPEQLAWAERERGAFYRRVLAFFRDLRLPACPVVNVPPFDVDLRYVDTVDGVQIENYIAGSLTTSAISMTACPAISVPAGFDDFGRPIGLQMVGPPQDEAGLLAIAAVFEEMTGLANSCPSTRGPARCHPFERFTELSEADATGRIAEIYAEIRHFYGVPYVSSLQRHLATIPGVLEWAWDAVRPAFASGLLPERAWALAAEVDSATLSEALARRPALAGRRCRGLETIRTVCRSFETVAPLNMAIGGAVRALLHGADASGTRLPPARHMAAAAPLPQPTGNPAPDAVATDTRPLLQLATDMDGETFIPGLYRQLAHWPAYLAHAATQLEPLFIRPRCMPRRCHACAAASPPPCRNSWPCYQPAPPPPPDAPAEHILAAIETYQGTSPQMITFGRLLREALPD